MMDPVPAPSAYCIVEPSVEETVLSRQKQLAERLRVQELLRYFLPVHSSTPAGTNKPRVSTDASLTAYAQLCALKLNCQRAFISLIDDTQQYIIAEATRSVSLSSGDIFNGEDDALAFGQVTLDLVTGVCPSTMACFTSPDDSLNLNVEYVKATKSYYVMNDMSKLEQFGTRPYIAGWPHMRYYAEVPLLSPSGYVIGSLCVVDNIHRDGVDMDTIRVLEEVAGTVTNHLELCSIKVQQNRAEHMIQALGQFSEGNNSIRGWWMDSQSQRNPEPAFRHLSIAERADVELGSKSGRLNPPNKLLHGTSESSLETIESDKELSIESPTPVQNPEARQRSIRKGSSESTTSTNASASTTEVHPKLAPNNNDVSDFQLPLKQGEMLSRATNLIREGIRSSGVVLLDPRSINGQLLWGRHSGGQDFSSDHGANTTSHPLDSPEGDSRLPCARVMSCSTRSGEPTDTIRISERALAILLRHFRDGGIISFDGKGIVRASTPSTLWDDRIFPARERPFGGYVGPEMNESEIQEIHEIDKALTGVTSLVAFPLWDTVRGKWFSYGLAWTTDPTRHFERQDFGFLSSFVNSIMAESSRIETMAANQAKNTFVSSISHELRSPLHGIMATMEILRGLTSDPTYEDEFSTVEACGSTLLDTIDNVLSFSKINNSTGHSNKPNPVVDLALLVEEIVTLSLSGNQFRKLHDVSNSSGDFLLGAAPPTVTVICDITDGYWCFETDQGSWKRVLLNLVGNSLKYTSSGFIVVKLEQQVSEQGSSREVILSIKDSGKGMSPDYLNNHLFKPFSQEDSLAPGTGLGLSIVSQLVTSLGGEIKVVSEQGSGTEITVVTKCQPPRVTEPATHSFEPKRQWAMKLGMFGLDVAPEFDDTPTGSLPMRARINLALQSAISSSSTKFGLLVVVADEMECDCDILLLPDVRYRELSASQVQSLGKPIIVLCSRSPGNKETQLMIPVPAVLLFEPFGPEAFHRAFKACLLTKDKLGSAQVDGASEGFHSAEEAPASIPLPIRESKPENALQPPSPEAPKILLVEDNSINLKLLAACTKQMNQPFTTAVNGSLAVEAYRNNSSNIELIFMDIQMPVMDGLEASRQIRKFEQFTGTNPAFIVALTALGSLEAKQAALDSGVDFFLTKPASLKRLKELVVQHCNPGLDP